MQELANFIQDAFLPFVAIVSTLIVALLGVRLFIPWYRRRLVLLGYAALLQGAAWNLVRQMENNPRHTAGKNRASQEAQFHKNVVGSADRFRLAGVPEVYAGELFPTFMAERGQQLVDFNRTDTDKFWFKAQGIRNGLQIFLDIMVLGNITAAYIKMIDHMRRQRDEFDEKGKKASPNFTELKQLFGLPTTWPTGEMPEQLEARGLTEQQALDIADAAYRHKHSILAKLHYKVWPEPGKEDEERQEFSGEDLLLAMRDYVR